jgi:hypothetical protein
VNLLASVAHRDLRSLANKTANQDVATRKDLIANFIRDQPRLSLGNMHIMGPPKNASSSDSGTPMVQVFTQSVNFFGNRKCLCRMSQCQRKSAISNS